VIQERAEDLKHLMHGTGLLMGDAMKALLCQEFLG
jgi:hypothetical protein